MWPLIDENKLKFDERNNKSEKFENCLKIDILNLRLKAMTWLTDSSNINKQSSITGLGELSAIYGYLKNKKRQKQQFQEKNWARKVPKAVKNEFFTKKFSVFNFFLPAMGIFFSSM